MKYDDSIPEKVAINEAVELAKFGAATVAILRQLLAKCRQAAGRTGEAGGPAGSAANPEAASPAIRPPHPRNLKDRERKKHKAAET